MNTVQRIAKNIIVSISSNIAGQILGLFYIMYTARYLGAEGFGALSFALAYTGIFASFSTLGLGTLMVREVARDKSLAKKYLGNFIIIKIFLAIITFGMIVLTINLLSYPKQTVYVVYLIGLSIIFGSFSNHLYAIFQAYERMEPVAIGNIINSLLLFFGTFFAINQKFDVIAFAYMYFFSSIIVLIYNSIICISRFTLPNFDIDLNFWKTNIRAAVPFSFTFIIAGMFFNIDIVILSIICGDNFSGYYKVAVNIILVILSTIDSFFNVIFPMISKLYVTEKDTLRKTLDVSSKYLFILFLPISVGIILLSDKFILLIYGAEFMPATIALQVLSAYLPIKVISNILGWTLSSINREPLRTYSAGIALILNICLDYVLIPILGILGASIATVISNIILFLMYYHFTKILFYEYKFKKFILNSGISCIMMSFIILIFSNANLFIIIFLSIFIYLISLIVLKTFDSYDREIFRSIAAPLKRYTGLGE